MLGKIATSVRSKAYEEHTTSSLIALAAIGLGLLVAPMVLAATHVNLLTQMLIFGLFALGFDFLYGYNGVVSFGHAAFYGLGAYLFGIPIAQFGIDSLLLVTLFAVSMTAIIGFVIATLSVRTKDVHFSILTLIWALVILTIVENLHITGRHDGFSVTLPELVLIPGVVEFSLYQPEVVYYLALVSLVVVFAILYRLVNSPLGEVLKGGRVNSERLKYIGYDERKFRIVSFTVSCGVAGLAGALQGMATAYVSPSMMDFLLSGEVIVWTVIGGAGTLVGPILGAGLITLAEHQLTRIITWWHIPLGIAFVAVVIYIPEGIVGKIKEIRND